MVRGGILLAGGDFFSFKLRSVNRHDASGRDGQTEGGREGRKAAVEAA